MKKLLLGCMLALALCPARSFADTDLTIIGGFVATAAEDNEDTGLMDIWGIRGARSDAKLPLVEDLVVYLRWQGGGEHTITLTLLEAAGDDEEILDEVEDTIDFEDWSTTFTTHELANVVFEHPGFYWIVVTLDGEGVINIPYFVNLDEEDCPEELWLLASIPAVDGYWADDDNGFIEGAFEHFTFAKYPGADDFAIVTLWFGGDDSYEQRVEIRGPDGATLAASEAQELDAYPGELIVATDYFDNFLFRVPGDYEVAVLLDDEEVFSYVLRAAQAD